MDKSPASITQESEKKKASKTSVFEVWKEYEAIAMHFNQLLIQLRMRALAGIAAITALVGFLSKGDTTEDFKWGIVSAVLLLLTIVWIAIWTIDAHYYKRLLFGSVRAVLDVEKMNVSKPYTGPIRLSHTIKETVEGDFSSLDRNTFWKDAVWWFYVIILVALLLGSYISLAQHCLTSNSLSLVHRHGVCQALAHWGPPKKY